MMKQFSLFQAKFDELKVSPVGKVYLKIVLGNFENGEEMLYVEAFAPIKN